MSFLSGRTSLTTVQTADIAAGAITTAKIAANNVDSTLTKDALIADYTEVTIATEDSLLLGDVGDSGNTKRDTVQGLLDLAGGGAWNLIGTEEAPGGSGTPTLDVTGLDSTYDTYAIAFSDLLPISDTAYARLRFGDSGGVDSGASDYCWGHSFENISSTTGTWLSDEDALDSQIDMSDPNILVGNAAGEGFGGMLYLHRPGDGTVRPHVTGTIANWDVAATTLLNVGFQGGGRNAVITLDRINFFFSTGNIETGRMTVWGLAHV